MRAAIYTRVSTEEQAREGLSLEAQENACRTEAERLRAETVEVFSDQGISASSLARPALQELLSRISEFDVLVVWRLDRLSRSLRDFSGVVDDLCDSQVGLASVTEHIDMSGAAGRLMLHIMGAFNEFYISILRENVIAAQEVRAERGLYHGKLPIGYVPTEGHLQPPTVDENAADFVRKLYSLLNGGMSLMDIRRWADSKRPHPNGRQWGTSAIKKILTNPFYIGMMRHRGDVIDAIHEPIISHRVFRRAQAKFAAVAHIHPKSRTHTFCGILRCGHCGGKMISHTAGHYQCDRQRLAGLAAQTHKMYVRRPKVDTTIWEVTRRVVDALDVDDMDEPDTEETAALKEAAAQLTTEIEYNLEAARRDAVPQEMLERQNRALVKKLARVTADLENELAQSAKEQSAKRVFRAGLPKRANHERKLELLHVVWNRIEVRRGEDELVELRFYGAWTDAVYLHKLPKYWFERTGLVGLGFD